MRNRNRPRDLVKRQRSFKKALIDEGMTVTAFARRLEISRFHLIRAFREPEMVGSRIHDAIDALIAKHQSASRSAAA
jgi:hypothetical protein